MEPSPIASTIRLALLNECRGYLWGGLMVGESNLGGRAGCGLGGRRSGTSGGTLRGVWG